MENNIIQIKQDLEKEILNIICWNNEFIDFINLKYFSPQVEEILKFAKQSYHEKGKVDIVKFRMFVSKYGIDLDDNVYTLKEFENLYNQIKELYNAIKLQEKIKLEVLSYLTSENFNYSKALHQLRAIAENMEASHSIIKTYTEVSEKVIESLKNNSTNNNQGYLTSIPTLDRKTKGLRKHQYVIIAARTNVGKTTFALWLSY